MNLKIDRRRFLTTSASAMLVVSSPLVFSTEGWANERPALRHSLNLTETGLNRREWKAIVVVQEHLFPSEINAPGASDVNAKAFLYAVLSDANRDDEDRKLVKQGLIALQDLCWKKHKLIFNNLEHEFREDMLREFEKTSIGAPWIMTILGYIFEALLTDPVYGGNTDGAGWTWLEHEPGFPGPNKDSRYFLL